MDRWHRVVGPLGLGAGLVLGCGGGAVAGRGGSDGGARSDGGHADGGKTGRVDARTSTDASRDALRDAERARDAAAVKDAGPAPCCEAGQGYGGGVNNNGGPPSCNRCCGGLFEQPYAVGVAPAVTCVPPAAGVDGSCGTGCGEGAQCAFPGSNAPCSLGDATVGGACVTVEPSCYLMDTMTVCGCDGRSLTFNVGCAGLPVGWAPARYVHTGACVDGG